MGGGNPPWDDHRSRVLLDFPSRHGRTSKESWSCQRRGHRRGWAERGSWGTGASSRLGRCGLRRCAWARALRREHAGRCRPAPAVLFVVAADEGWRAQSEEHLAAIDALGVRHGVLAVTRSDVADPGPAIEEASGRIARSSLGHVDAVAVSSVTGMGLSELRAAIGRLIAALPQPDPAADVRL